MSLSVCGSVGLSPFCLSPGDKQIVCPPGDKHFSTLGGGDKYFSMIMMMIEYVSEVNILSSEARKPPAGARISGPVGSWNSCIDIF